jgi:ATP-dependent Zn protease
MAADDAWDREDMEKAAYHEAGHAVVAWSFDLVVGSVHLDVANNSGHAKIADAHRLEDVTHRVAVSYAGFEAEDTFKRPAVFVRAQDDFDRASEAFASVRTGGNRDGASGKLVCVGGCHTGGRRWARVGPWTT